jgi:glycosyltransferase involved in cell wall biosynthesis
VSVSVVIPTHNRAATLSRAIVSAAMQNPEEVVVVDDASTDDTPGIVEQLRGVYPCLRYVRHAERSADWQEASAAVYPSLVGSHVVMMGADDALVHGVIDSIEQHQDAAVVFHDYYVCTPEDKITHGVTCGYKVTTELDAEATQHRIVHWPYPSETGIGAGIRREHLAWLTQRQWWLMGPWSDCIGYGVAAALYGCVYVPMAGAVFTLDPAGYGATGRDGPDQSKYFKAVRSFVDGFDLPADVRRSMCVRRQVPYA